MKILFISRTIFPEVTGGGDVSGFEIARAVSKHAEVVVCCLSERISSPIVETLEGVKIYRFPWRKLSWSSRLSNLEYCYWQLWRASRKIQKVEHPDIVHLLNFGALFPLAFGFPGVPKVATANGPWFCMFGGSHGERPCCKCSLSDAFGESWKQWGLKSFLFFPYIVFSSWVLWFSVMACTRIIPVSEAMRKMFIMNSIPRRKLCVIHNPVRVPARKISRSPLVPRGVRTLVYAGRLSREKGVHFVIRALPHIDNVMFLIAGKGRFEEQLRLMVKQLGVEGKVKFLGFLGGKELSRIVASCDANVLLGAWYEPLPRSVIEASAVGVPSIVSDVGGNAESVGTGGIAVSLMDPIIVADAIKKVLSKRKMFSENAKKYVKEQFSPELVGGKLMELYQEISGRT